MEAKEGIVMAMSSIQKQNTIQKNYQKQTYQTKQATVKQQQSEQQQIVPEENIEQDTITKDVFEQYTMPQTSNQNKQNEKKNTSDVDYKPTEDLIKLMQAKTVSEVRSIIGKIQGEMGRIKASGGEAEQIKNAVAKMKKVIKKAQNKEKALKLESKMEIQIKMEQKKEAEQAKQTSQELQGKRRNRMSKEISDVLNSTNDFSGNASSPSSFMDTSLSMADIGSVGSIDINI